MSELFEVQFPELQDRNWVEERWLRRRMSAGEMAEELGCQAWSVWKAIRAFGLPRGSNRERLFAELDAALARAGGTVDCRTCGWRDECVDLVPGGWCPALWPERAAWVRWEARRLAGEIVARRN